MNMKTILLPAALAAMLLAGCSTTPEVTTYVNPNTGKPTDILTDNLVDQPGNHRELLWLNAWRVPQGKDKYQYYLEVVYGAREEVGYLDIGPGRALTIIADGEQMQFSGLGSLMRDREGTAWMETARYEASAYEIEKIAQAQRVTVRVTGKNGVVVREFAPDNFKRFQEFARMTSQQ
jgi:hypothetical protein